RSSNPRSPSSASPSRHICKDRNELLLQRFGKPGVARALMPDVTWFFEARAAAEFVGRAILPAARSSPSGVPARPSSGLVGSGTASVSPNKPAKQPAAAKIDRPTIQAAPLSKFRHQKTKWLWALVPAAPALVPDSDLINQ